MKVVQVLDENLTETAQKYPKSQLDSSACTA